MAVPHRRHNGLNSKFIRFPLLYFPTASIQGTAHNRDSDVMVSIESTDNVSQHIMQVMQSKRINGSHVEHNVYRWIAPVLGFVFNAINVCIIER